RAARPGWPAAFHASITVPTRVPPKNDCYSRCITPEAIIPNTLIIAGVDPSGGAGILADIKAMSALGAYGTAVVAALTAQNTLGVTDIAPVAPGFVATQTDTLFADVRIDAVKIGMLGQQTVTRVVA